jgi:hypothetical protein
MGGIKQGCDSNANHPALRGRRSPPRAESEQRYQIASHIKKAELIEGVVYVSSPTRSKSHAPPHGRLITWLGIYEAATLGVALNEQSRNFFNRHSVLQTPYL